jgi:hypothetical protein
MVDVIADCGAKERANAEAAVAQATAPIDPLLQRARGLRDGLREIRNQRYGSEALQAFADQQNQAAVTLAQAEARLNEARKTVNVRAAGDAQRLAQSAVAQFDDVSGRVRAEMQRLARDADERAAAVAKAEAGARDAKIREEALRQSLGQAQSELRLAQEAMNAYRRAAGTGQVPPIVTEAEGGIAAADRIVRRGTAAGETDLRNAIAAATRARDTLVRERERVLATATAETSRIVTQLVAAGNASVAAIDRMSGSAPGVRLSAAETAAVQEDRRALARVAAALTSSAKPDSVELAGHRAVAEQARGRLEALVEVLRRRAASADVIPPELIAAARALFAAQYDDARARLDAVRLSPAASAALRFQVQLLRAAALYGAWAAGGEQDEPLRQAAAQAVAECKRIAPGGQPDAAAFSPRFIAFYRNPA